MTVPSLMTLRSSFPKPSGRRPANFRDIVSDVDDVDFDEEDGFALVCRGLLVERCRLNANELGLFVGGALDVKYLHDEPELNWSLVLNEEDALGHCCESARKVKQCLGSSIITVQSTQVFFC